MRLHSVYKATPVTPIRSKGWKASQFSHPINSRKILYLDTRLGRTARDFSSRFIKSPLTTLVCSSIHFSRFVPKGHRWPGYAYFLDIRGWPIHPYDLLKPNIPNEFSCFSIDNIIAIQSIWLIDNRGWKIFMLRGNIGMVIYHISGKYCHPCYIYNFFDSLILMYIRHDYYI